MVHQKEPGAARSGTTGKTGDEAEGPKSARPEGFRIKSPSGASKNLPVLPGTVCIFLLPSDNFIRNAAHAGFPNRLLAASATLDTFVAKTIFAEAKVASDLDSGKLWGIPLYGPLMLVDSQARKIIANEPDAGGNLHAENGVYVGALPEGMFASNTAIEWQGRRWTMVAWPLSSESMKRIELLEHEQFHRIQPTLHLNAKELENPHLDTEKGRLWILLEWRALATALQSQGAARTEAIRDALLFRAERMRLFPGAVESERVMEINEGLAEYTGITLATPDAASARWWAMQALLNQSAATFVRSFPYVSGPAYGLLLDIYVPDWRSKITNEGSLPALLSVALPKGGVAASAEKKAVRYGMAGLAARETERAMEADKIRLRYRASLIDGPVLLLTRVSDAFSVNFDPRLLIPLGQEGTVYPTIEVSDVWGVLTVTDGALMPSGFSQVSVSAPSVWDGALISGSGWSLRLARGWKLTPSGKAGSYTLTKVSE